MKQKQTNEFYLLFISLYPAIALLGHNIEEVKPLVAFRSLVVSLLIAVICLGVLLALIKNRTKAALLTTLTLGLFFSYGHVYNSLKQTGTILNYLARHRFLGTVWLLLLIAGGVWIVRHKGDLCSWTTGLNLIAVVVLILPIGQIGLYEYRELTTTGSPSITQNANMLHPPKSNSPDIYYIILDAYGRDDILQDMYQVDNSVFLEKLQSLGFYVARCSRSNYAQTQLSLASSLNMDYIQNLGSEYLAGRSTRVGLDQLIHHSAVRAALKNIGYRMVAFETGFKYTQVEDADLYLSPGKGLFEGLNFSAGLNGFEVMLINTTAGRIITDVFYILPAAMKPVWEYPEEAHRNLILFDLAQLHQLPMTPGPKFVFAHIVAPHPPYVFEADGSFSVPDKSDYNGYRDQILYLNTQMEAFLSDIIRVSKVPPIIILQGDHGPILAAPKQRMKILNAYYFPGPGKEKLSASITPVNTFRLIFDTYFGGKYGELDDKSYFSSYQDPYNFINEPDDRQGCQK